MRSPDTLPEVIAEQARAVIGANVCILHIHADQAGAPGRVAVSCTSDEAFWRQQSAQLGLLGTSVKADRATRLSLAELAAAPGWYDFLAHSGWHAPVCGWLSMPVTGSDRRPLGWIQLLDSSAGEFSEVDEVLLHQLAQTASLALEVNALQGAARDAIQTRDEFLSLIAHELKNPLTSMRGFAQLILRQLDKGEAPEPDRLRHSLKAIEEQSERMTRLINDVREVARLDSRRVTLELKPVNMATLAESVAEELQSRISRRLVALDSSEPVRATVDPLRWRQLLTHLIEYVCASSTGSEPLVLEAINLGDGVVQLAVSDPGSSLSSENWQLLLDRVQSSRSPASLGGAGINLYIAYRMIQLHGGELGIEPLSEGGMRVAIRLPGGPAHSGTKGST